MAEKNLLQQALKAIHAGSELTARDIFLEIVEADPRNETAWMWLTGLLDNLEDRIHACEQVLLINPQNEGVRGYLSNLLDEKQKKLAAEGSYIEQQLQLVREEAQAGNREAALQRIRILVREKATNADVWRLLAELSPELNEQVLALEELSTLAPEDVHLQEELKRLHHFQQNSLDLATMYEEKGNLDKAIAAYGLAMSKTASKQEWDNIYWKVMQLENQRQEKITHVSPGLSLVRLTSGPALLYLSLTLTQVGVNPFTHPEPLLWIGLLWVLLGGFMVALATVRSHHRLWYILFKDVGAGGSPMARFAMAAAGWTLILLPHLVLFVVALDRLLLNPG